MKRKEIQFEIKTLFIDCYAKNYDLPLILRELDPKKPSKRVKNYLKMDENGDKSGQYSVRKLT